MATINKNFRIKNGLIVEGSTATVNGSDILTKSQADQSYIVDLIGGQATSQNTADTVVKRDGSGNFAAGTITANLTGDVTGTVSSLSNHDSDDLSEGSVNLYFTDARARAALSSGTGIDYNSSTGVIAVDNTIATKTYADNAAESAVNALDTDDIEEGASNLYFTNQRALDATSAAYDAAGAASSAQSAAEANAATYTDNKVAGIGGSYIDWNGQQLDVDVNGLGQALGQTFDAYGAASSAASTAEANAATYTDNAINALDTDDIEEGVSNVYYTDSRARGAISAGTGISYDSGTGVVSVDNTIATQSYVDTAVSNLIDGAPALLDTLNEIAAAINDDENYFTTVANSIATKQNTLTAGANIDITNDTISVSGLDTDDVAEGTNLYFTDSRARDAVDGTDRSFTSVEINEISKEVAATTGNIATAAATTAYSWDKTTYRSAKFMVKVKNGTHTEVSEILITLDTSDNVYVTEYGMSSTSGSSLGTITADVSSNDVRIRVTPANNNSEVIVAGTLLV
jgi:hypothetical protein